MNLEQPKRFLKVLLIVLMIILTGCKKYSNIIEENYIPVQIQEGKSKSEATTSNLEKDENLIEETEIEDFDKLGITIKLPENTNWIEKPTYSIIEETVAQVEYYDKIADVDMTLRVGKEDIQTLSGINHSFDDKFVENWFARTEEDGSPIDIKVQYAISDEGMKDVFVSWNYKEFNYTLWGSMNDKDADISPIAKTAVYIAQYMR